MSEQNNFGLMSIEYDLVRRGYPEQVFEYLKSLKTKDKLIILDVGCGTGISTRELKYHSFDVIGSDKDEAMIKVAISKNSEIQYVVATADKLPFDSEKFDIVTAFTAFHWFNNEDSLNEIKRVLKNDGIFFAALKISKEDDFTREYFSILKKYAGDNFDTTKDHFKKEFLNKAGFSGLTEKFFYVDEKYTVEEALILLQSLSLWNLVEENKKLEMLEEIKEFYENNLVDGLVLMNREISTVVAHKR